MDGMIDGGKEGSEKNALLKKWDERVGKAVKAAGKQHALYKKCRDAVDLREKNEARKVNPYLIHSTLSALVPALYAKNPEIEVRPARLAAEVRGEVSPWVAFAEVAEDLLQREFVDNTDLKRRAKGCLLSTLTTGSGWLKMTLQDDYRADPMQYNRLNDAQDNVAEIEALQRELDEPAADEEAVAEALKFHTAHVEAALQGRSELFVQKGLVIDRVAAEDLYVVEDAESEVADDAKADEHPAPVSGGQLSDRRVEHRDVIGGRGRPGVTRAQQPSQRLPGPAGAMIGERQQRVEPEPALVVRRRALLVRMRPHQGGVQIHDHRAVCDRVGL